MTTFSEVTITNSLTLQNGVGLQIQGGNINAAGAQNLPVDPIGNPSPTTLVSNLLQVSTTATNASSREFVSGRSCLQRASN